MSVIGEALLSAAIDTLFHKLASTDLLQFASREKIHADLQKWKNKLVMIEAVLDDAEEKQTANRLVEIWLGELKKLAYDVEDILDEFATEALRRKLLDEPQASTSKVRKFIPTCCTGLDPRSLKLNSTMASQIKEITTRLQQIVEDKNSFDLTQNSGTRSNRARYQRPPATHLNEPQIYGRDHDKEKILELLLKDDGARAKFSVVSIEGFGGLGKTTLAQLAYNDTRVKNHFDIQAWVCVYEDFDVVRITKTILQSITSAANDVDNLSMLHDKLKEKLSGKKFCIVLDDVWNEKYEEWTILCRPFEACSIGSKIVVTTRNHGVSLTVGASPAYELKELSNDDCLSIFTHHSLGKMDFNEHQDLKEIGEKIVERCKGMPLAAKTLGGLLCGKVNSEDWKYVLDSNLWNLPEEKSGIIPALRVSYYYLPSHLKMCFAYCSLFPKDYVFVKEELILLWMAEGFLQTESSGKQAEDLGEEYFDDLHSRSFFQQFRNDDGFVMHDLINDLAQWAGKDFFCTIDTLQEGEKQWKIPENIRHLCLLNDKSIDEFIRKSGALNEMKSVRTFLTLSSNFLDFGPSYDFPCMVLQLQRLRVLSLKGYFINDLPEQIGDLKLLHHLDLSYSPIEVLPDSVNRLYNLETLLLIECDCLKRLCSDMGNLIKLRHICLSVEYELEGMPLRIGRLTSLRTLPIFVVGKNMGSGLRELKDLMDLRERLDISGLENVNDSEDAEKANLRGKGGLKHLGLKWTRSSDGSNEREIAAQVLEKLQPCQKLESLHILGYGGTRFPQWLGDTSLSSLVSLTFDDCAFLPSIGQLPSLKKLRIRDMPKIESLGPEFYGHGYSTKPFLSLEEFHIENLQEWRDWIPCRNVEAFPRLRRLSINKYPKLQGKLLEHLPSLESLSIEDCEQWRVSVPMLPEHCHIQILRCKEVVQSSMKDCSLLKSMVHFLSGISSRMFLAEGFTKGFSKIERLEMVDYDEGTPFLKIGCDSKAFIYQHFDSFMIGEEEEELQQQEEPCRVQYIVLEDIKCHVKLEEAFQSLSFLRGLSISESPNIISFQESSLPSQLRFIVIKECNALQSLPRAWMHSSNTSLKNLSISRCDSLTCIARVQLPPNLKRLHIKDCSNLLTVLEEEQVSGSCMNTPILEYLKIENCPSLTSLWSKSNELPDTLGKIKLSRCSNLATLASRGNLPKALRYLSITQCSKLESIAKTFHDNMKLEKVYIFDCEKLETLPSGGINNLISLRELVIWNCPGMVSIPVGGFLTKVTVLAINGMEICKSLFEWGLHRLTSLEVLVIGGCPDVMSFPQEETRMILPNSLTTLRIGNFPNLERISSVVQNLTCLEKLGLSDCPKLEYFPENGLPKSLKQLYISDCPLLEERCKDGEGGYWPMIRHLSDKEVEYGSSEEVETNIERLIFDFRFLALLAVVGSLAF